LLLRFSIRSSITVDRQYFRVGITSYDNIRKFGYNIGFVTEEKNNIINAYLAKKGLNRTVKDRIPLEFNNRIIKIMQEEKIEKVEKYKIYDIIYDHQKRKDKFAFSVPFIRNLLTLVKSEENKFYLNQFVQDIGWEYISGTEVIINENEQWVYDVTIEPSHTFISQGAVLHNTVTISKANIHATLRAETTVLAAGNPKLGRFDPYTAISQQVDISPSLLSRFDVIFIIKDIPNKVQDAAIASHVLQEHKQEVIRDTIEPRLLRKYIAYAKQKIKPKLTDEAINEIKEFYVKLRNQSGKADSAVKPIAITARQLEGIIRLSEACAKVRLSVQVTKEDAQKAIELIKLSLTQVGYDEETKSFDIDKIGGVPSSKRNKILIVKEALAQMESRLGKLIPIEELEKTLEGKISVIELDDALNMLTKEGDIFRPKKGFIQRM
jgi:replicative DNA helicase Mcm